MSYDRQLEIITEGTTEASVTVDKCQIPEKVPIRKGLDVLNVESMVILQDTAQ